MRYPASEKLEIIHLVEQSHLPVRRTLDKLGIQPSRFYRWYDRLQTGGPEALEDKVPRPKRVWNRIPDAIRERIVQMALDEPELSPRELATRFTDTAGYFVSEASVYRLLKAHDLIASVERPMRRFIHRENIKHFRSLLDTEKDETRRKTILKFPAEEEAKENDADGDDSSQRTA
jgi:transposase-like protein